MIPLKKYLLMAVYSIEIVLAAIYTYTLFHQQPYSPVYFVLFIYQLFSSFFLKRLLTVHANFLELIYRYLALGIFAVSAVCALIGLAVPPFFVVPYLAIILAIPILLILHLFATLLDLKIVISKQKGGKSTRHTAQTNDAT
ncbi:hypothetical protein SAMN05660909_03273 [Chitinophaga terrae (ex Kim and Jung 2007)]|uniref:Uncharacterized protein n=1 Tax=Chitinophaga terrae (ex Kim and Jung 2007) TaxID=408074 RepID=A0A1H4DQ16_9BACT|nr:hypothetical protein [Chitinophaga terrae (ex Kim and Jung 2007)]GEP91071.1 hypothetical protein CTE07_27160 [Chitinophaga terrae (ex Kim and Jung 2007)]SEA74855.1 hypothetical protein SAMN05660909_03273 [Chitinophaga terrae (ex Kim and Jung 2007)]